MSYPGGKAGPGVYQRLINEIPPHDVYVAGFAGRDAIAQFKRPARRNVLIDLDPEPLDWWAEYSGFELHRCDAIEWLRVTFGLTAHHRTREKAARPEGSRCVVTDPQPRGQSAHPGEAARYRDWFVFLDPPYLMDTRTSGPMYRWEMSDEQHEQLLRVASELPCMVMLCGYWSQMYTNALPDWRMVEYFSVARSGERRREIAWCNYPPPTVLHDASFVGADKREREKVRRRIRRLSSNLAALAPHERQAVLDAVLEIQPTDMATGARSLAHGCTRHSHASPSLRSLGDSTGRVTS